ncbi:MAG TPA: translation elongation factor Ts [Acidimicrobiales bacterium]|nr:translation elongation factor Ts [Acidimicrobiales bacterium]
MPDFTAKDVQALRQRTGVGMLDAKRALEESDGDMEAALQWLRVHGLSSAAKRDDREASEGAVAAVRDGAVAALAELRCETDFVAKNPDFVSLVDEIAARVASEGTGILGEFTDAVDKLRTTLKENISIGRVERLEATGTQVVDTYVHKQSDRGVNAVAVVLDGGSESLAHDVAVHIAFAKPLYLSREDVPAGDVAAERATIEALSRNEGKPEAALPKIIEGRLNGWYKERVLLEQDYARDEKQTITQLLGAATIVAFAQVLIGS